MPRSILSAEERTEYEALLHDATRDKAGKLLPSREVPHRVHALLLDAVKAGRGWAEIELERALLDGLRGDARRYLRRANTTTVTDLTGTKSRSAVYSVREKQTSGGVAWQPKLLSDFTAVELAELIRASNTAVAAYVANREAAERLLEKVRSANAATVRDALSALGLSLEEALAVSVLPPSYRRRRRHQRGPAADPPSRAGHPQQQTTAPARFEAVSGSRETRSSISWEH